MEHPATRGLQRAATVRPGSLPITLKNSCNVENPLCRFFRWSFHFKIHRGKDSSEVLGKAQKAARVIDTHIFFFK